MTVYRLLQLDSEPLNIELHAPFGIATGAQARAENVLVSAEVATEDTARRAVGYGEAAPFEAVSGETQARVLSALGAVQALISGQTFEHPEQVSERLGPRLKTLPSAVCALQTAVLDAVCKLQGMPLLRVFGHRRQALKTDVTVTTGSAQAAGSAARQHRARGFSSLKVKVGGAPLEHDLERLRAICSAAPDCQLLLDANGSYSVEQSLELIERLGPLKERIALYEQPTSGGDFSALAQVRDALHIPVAADESARSAADVERLALLKAVDVINIKIMKSGVFEAQRMIQAARRYGLSLMIGGMVESKLSMTVSACLASATGAFAYIDLDTPMFMKDTPLLGGFTQEGPYLRLDDGVPGHGVRPI